MKTLRQAVGDYLSLRRGLGFKLKKHEPCLAFSRRRGRTGLQPGWPYSLQRNIGTNNRRNGPLASVWCADSPATGAAMISSLRYLCPDSCLTVPCVHDLTCTQKKRSGNC